MTSTIVGAAIGAAFFEERFRRQRIAAAGLPAVGIGLMLRAGQSLEPVPWMHERRVRSTLETGVPEVIVMMKTAVGWHVELEFKEDDQHTRAVAMVRLPDGSELRSHGRASRHHTDANQPRVGEEIAGARALNDLAMQLLSKAHTEIDEASGRTSQPIHI